MSYPLYGNVYLGNVSGNIKLHVHAFEGNSTGIGYNNDSMTFGINQTALDTPKMLINKIGDMDILGNISTGRNLVVNSTTASTSTTSGALKVAGGVGIVGNVYTGGNLVVNSTTASTSSTTGALQVAGGVGIVGNVYTGGNLVVNSTTASISTTSGALQVAGGVGIVGNLNIGGLTNHLYDTSFNGNAQILSTTASTSSTTGALRVAGGAGIVGSLNTGGNLVVNSTTASTSSTTGALQVAGGVGIVGNVYTGGNLVVNSTTASISTTSGALRVAGGVGIGGNLNVGGFSNFEFDSSFNGNIQLTQATNPLWFVSKNTSTINGTLNSIAQDVGIFYGTTYPAAAGLIISPRGIGGGIKLDMHGNVGIGKHPTEKLDVNGMVRSSDLRIDNGNIHLGQNAGLSQGANSIAIGYSAGQTTQGIRSIAIGDYAGSSSQGHNSIAIGRLATTGSGENSIAIGHGATTSTGGNSIAIGTGATTSTFGNSVAIGIGASCSMVSQVSIGTTISKYRLAGLFANNYIHYRLATQSIPHNVITAIKYDTTVNAGNCGIGYDNTTGVFTNNNAYTVVCSVSFTTIFAGNATGTRVIWLQDGVGQRYGNTEQLPNSTNVVAITSSCNIALTTGQTFRIIGFQTSTSSLNVGVGQLSIPVEVSMLVW